MVWHDTIDVDLTLHSLPFRFETIDNFIVQIFINEIRFFKI